MTQKPQFSTPETTFAVEAVREASQLIKRIQQSLVTSSLTKNDRSPVTVADFASQARIGYLLSRDYPHDPLIGEEDSSALQAEENRETLDLITKFVSQASKPATREDVCRWIDRGSASSGSRYWTLDPIDGTKGFLRGNQYAVALALVVDGIVQVGVLGCPNISHGMIQDFDGPGSLVVAERGSGTWVTELMDDSQAYKRLRVSNCKNPIDARVMRSFESSHTNSNQVDEFADTLGLSAEPVRMDSQAKYAVLAAGGGELYLRLLSPDRRDYREKIWDQAAGSIVIEEAGGKVTDLSGKALDFTRGRTLADNRGICASNGYLHTEAVSALRKINA